MILTVIFRYFLVQGGNESGYCVSTERTSQSSEHLREGMPRRLVENLGSSVAAAAAAAANGNDSPTGLDGEAEVFQHDYLSEGLNALVSGYVIRHSSTVGDCQEDDKKTADEVAANYKDENQMEANVVDVEGEEDVGGEEKEQESGEEVQENPEEEFEQKENGPVSGQDGSDGAGDVNSHASYTGNALLNACNTIPDEKWFDGGPQDEKSGKSSKLTSFLPHLLVIKFFQTLSKDSELILNTVYCHFSSATRTHQIPPTL